MRNNLLSMYIASGKSLNILFKLYVNPMSVNVVFKGWNWSLINVSQSQRFSRSEENAIISKKICVNIRGKDLGRI